MHGRVKVKSSATLEKENLAKREQKLLYFQTHVKRIFELRSKLKENFPCPNKIEENGEHKDTIENEKAMEEILIPLLKATAEILVSNPDILTFWNIRRDVLLRIKEIFSSKDENGKKDELIKHWKSELILTIECLPANPKAYGTWHHRCWTMLQIPKPDWDKDIDLCTMYLTNDERNFHCWDYRRFVVNNSKALGNRAKSELDFSFEKIQNISNYSAWHYRSKLLPVVHPSKTSAIGVNKSKRREELRLVENAIFTDPGDSSAWFYYRWLLSSCRVDVDSYQAKLQIVKKRKDNKILIATSAEINANDSVSLELVSNDVDKLSTRIDIRWNSTNGMRFDNLWISDNEVLSSLKISLEGCDPVILGNNDEVHILKNHQLDSHPDDETLKILEEEKENIKELIELNESAGGTQAASDEEKKWTKLNLALITKTIDPSPQCIKTIAEMFLELEDIDHKRKSYYADQRSRIIIENYLKRYVQAIR